MTRQRLTISRQKSVSTRALDVNEVIAETRPGPSHLADGNIEPEIERVLTDRRIPRLAK